MRKLDDIKCGHVTIINQSTMLVSEVDQSQVSFEAPFSSDTFFCFSLIKLTVSGCYHRQAKSINKYYIEW